MSNRNIYIYTYSDTYLYNLTNMYQGITEIWWGERIIIIKLISVRKKWNNSAKSNYALIIYIITNKIQNNVIYIIYFIVIKKKMFNFIVEYTNKKNHTVLFPPMTKNIYDTFHAYNHNLKGWFWWFFFKLFFALKINSETFKTWV